MSVTNFFKSYFHNSAKIFSVRLQDILRRHSYYHCTKGFWYFSEIFCVWIQERTETFHEMFWQVCGNIYWNILRKLPVKILKILHKILQKIFCKVSRLIHISVTKFLNPYFHNFTEIFLVTLQEMLRKHSHNHFREGFCNFSEIFCV